MKNKIKILPSKNCIILIILVVLSCSIIQNKNLGRGYRYNQGGNYYGTNPSMSPDGTKIAFGSVRYGAGDICIINTDGSILKRLTDTPEYEGEPRFSPDGTKIVFVSERDDGNTGHIYLMNIDGTNQQQITKSKYYDSFPSISPGGDKIIFNRVMENNNYEVFIINLDGTDEKRLTFSNKEEAYPIFSPHGDKIFYTCQNKIWEMNIDGTNIHALMEMKECGKYVFSTDRKIIACLSTRDTDYTIDPNTKMDIFILRNDGSRLQRVTYTKKYKSGHSFNFPGTEILFFEHESDGRGKGQVRIVNIDGSNLRTITNNY